MELISKLQVKPGQTCKIFFKPRSLELPGLKNSRLSPNKVNSILCFFKTVSELEEWVTENIRCISQDCILWFAYPKKSSPLYIKFKSDINRDQGWECLKPYKYRPVRSIAIDADWTALRFRLQEQVKASSKKFQI